jgi:hypothetical protein
MESFFKKIAILRRGQLMKQSIRLAAIGCVLRYGLLTTDLFINTSKEIQATNNKKTYIVADNEQSLIESKPVNYTRIKTGSGALINIRTSVQPSKALKSALEIRSGSGAAEFDDQDKGSFPDQSQESKTFDYDYRSNDLQKKKKLKDQCPIYEQNKAGIDELPDSSEFTYSLETKTAKKALKTLWKNPDAKKEVLAGLDKMNKGELLPRNQKNFKGFKTLKEIKLTDTRMLIQPGKNGDPDQIVAIFMRRDLENIASIFKGKYK